jgi:hypothetical protein
MSERHKYFKFAMRKKLGIRIVLVITVLEKLNHNDSNDCGRTPSCTDTRMAEYLRCAVYLQTSLKQDLTKPSNPRQASSTPPRPNASSS